MMTRDYSELAKRLRAKQWSDLKAVPELLPFIVSESELPPLSQTNVIDFIPEQLSANELTITNSNVSRLLSCLQLGEFTSEEVLLAFLHRAIIAQQLVNPITHFHLDSLQRARELDLHFKQHGPIGPLHGLPITIKNEFDLAGTQTTIGLVSQAHSPDSSKTSPNLIPLIEAGCIIFAKTNTPTACFNIETKNNVHGKTVNPYQRNFSSGGSTGGEAALLALRGSAMGIGSDLGGSIRQPASFTGLYGIKPSSGRVPHSSSKIVIKGLESLKGTNGAMANDVDALGLYLNMVLKSQPWLSDTDVVPLPWNEQAAAERLRSKQALRFGILFDDGMIKPQPAITRALQLVKEKLTGSGHEVIDWNMEAHYNLRSISIFADLFMSSNGMKKIRTEIAATNELPLESFEAPDIPVSELWELQLERTTRVNEFWNKWQELGLDGLISPVTALSGCEFGQFHDLTYSPLANVIDFPAVVLPVTTVDKSIDLYREVKARTVEESQVWGNYNPEKSDGVPVGIQVIGPKLQEEYTLELAKVIDRLLHRS